MKQLLFLLLTTLMLSFTMPDKFVTVLLITESEDDVVTVTSIRTSLMSAEKVAGLLDVKLIASDDPVQDDVYIFSLQSESQKELTMQMFDEEGYELVANREMSVEQGNNYKALNVNSIEDGTYIFTIKDEAGNEVKKSVNIKR